MFISITFPAKYYCPACLSYQIDTKLELKLLKGGRYYSVKEVCPSCKSDKIEPVGLFRKVLSR